MNDNVMAQYNLCVLCFRYVAMYERFADPKPVIIEMERPYGYIKGVILSKLMEIKQRARTQ